MVIKNKYCVIDTETGGLFPNKNPICEIAFVILDSDFNEVERYSKIIKGYDNLVYEKRALDVHGIRMSEIDAGTDIKVALKEIESIWASHCSGRSKVMLVGHNIRFDYDMLEYAFNYCGMDIHAKTEKVILDTLWMARLAWGHDDSMVDFKLGTCCERANCVSSDAHRAMGDVLSTADLFKFLVNMSRQRPQKSDSSIAATVDGLRKHQFKF